MTAAPETARGDRGRGGHLGFILNVTYVAEPDRGRAVVHLYGRLADGRPFLVRDRRREPYFYVESSAVEQASALGLRNLDTTDRRTLHGAPVHRVRLHRPGDAPEIRARLHGAGVPTYEADVRFAYRYLIDRGIKSALRIHGAARSLDSPATDARSESAGRQPMPVPRLSSSSTSRSDRADSPATLSRFDGPSARQSGPSGERPAAPRETSHLSERPPAPQAQRGGSRGGAPPARAPEPHPGPEPRSPAGSPGTPWAPWETVVFDEPEVEPAHWTPALTTLSLDIETDPEAQRLLSVALWGCGAREVLLLCADAAARAACPAGAVPCAGEAELLATLCARVRALDPDVVTGWNIIDFDVPVLIRRAAALQVPLEMGRAPGAVRQRGESGRRRDTGGNGGGGRRFSDSIFIPGRVVLDGIRLLRAVSYRLDSYSLENAAREILGEGKRALRDPEDGESGPAGIGYGAALSDQSTTVAGGDRAAQIMRTFHHDPERFVEYNLTDARLVLDILDKLDLVPFTAERSALTGMPPDRVGSSIAAFDFLYLSRLHAHRIVAPTVGAEQRTGNGDGEGQHPMHGGHILKPRPGLHDDVLLFDFKSLYPSIIRTFQIDPVGLIRDQPAGALRAHRDDGERGAAGAPVHADRYAPQRAADGDVIEAPNGARFRRGRGILTELLDDLFTSREKAKAAGNTIASNAIKVLMNSFYGVLGTGACRFSHPLLANAITSFGKHFLLWAKDWMEARGLTVLYGDTDSLFVAGSHRDHGPALAARLNAALAEYVTATWRVRSYLEMEFETHYERLLLPSVRGGGRGATKRYVGLTDGKLRFTGMEVVRRDWTALAHEVQRELYRRLFADEPVEEYLRAVIGEVTSGRRDEQLVYHKALRKDADDYRAAAPHVVAARKRAAQPGEPSSWRGVIDYVITVEGPEPADGRLHRIDYEHYVERQVRPVAEPVLATTGRDFGEVRRNERQLELF